MTLRNSTGILLLALALAPACRSGNGLEVADSNLSDVSLGNFAPGQGLPTWSAGQLIVFSKKDNKAILTKSFGSEDKNVSTPGFTVPYGNYNIQLTYFSDSTAKTPVYKSCLNDSKEEIVYSLDEPKEVLKVEICRVKDDSSVGSTDGKDQSDVAIQPVLKTPSDGASESTQKANLASFKISGKAATAATDVTVELTNLGDKAVFCQVKAMLVFKSLQGSTSTITTESRVTESLSTKGATATLTFKVTGMEVFGEAGKDMSPELMTGSKAFGVCRTMREAAAADFESDCNKENSTNCSGVVPAS